MGIPFTHAFPTAVSHLASEAAGFTRGTSLRRQTAWRTPETSQSNQPHQRDASGYRSPNASIGFDAHEGDTPFGLNKEYATR